jgi:hypothetical protein
VDSSYLTYSDHHHEEKIPPTQSVDSSYLTYKTNRRLTDALRMRLRAQAGYERSTDCVGVAPSKARDEGKAQAKKLVSVTVWVRGRTKTHVSKA